MKIVSAKTKYNKEIVENLKKELGYKNNMSVPKIEKITINVGTGKFLKESEKIKEIQEALAVIAGQAPVKTKAKKAIAGFKTRAGLEIGMKITLRGKKMWDFFDRLINVSIPRTRDFQGIKRSSVGRDGNLNLGIRDHVIFPEIVPEQVKFPFSLQVVISSTAKTQEEGMKLFELMGVPFNKK
ncbi:MAG: 50S ribosomal protein L5 [Candidatus Moranbacteria bacterium]|nr:50S ribosomal protein L5 [Candidatus Moranbacteria bacterium]